MQSIGTQHCQLAATTSCQTEDTWFAALRLKWQQLGVERGPEVTPVPDEQPQVIYLAENGSARTRGELGPGGIRTTITEMGFQMVQATLVTAPRDVSMDFDRAEAPTWESASDEEDTQSLQLRRTLRRSAHHQQRKRARRARRQEIQATFPMVKSHWCHKLRRASDTSTCGVYHTDPGLVEKSTYLSPEVPQVVVDSDDHYQEFDQEQAAPAQPPAWAPVDTANRSKPHPDGLCSEPEVQGPLPDEAQPDSTVPEQDKEPGPPSNPPEEDQEDSTSSSGDTSSSSSGSSSSSEGDGGPSTWSFSA